MSDSIRISVIIPAFNAGPYLAATLESVLAEGTDGVEVIVVDDRSTDDTCTIAESFATRGVRVIRGDRHSGGPSVPRNRGVTAARGDFIALFDADDLMRPGRLSRSLAVFERYPEIGLVFTDAIRFLDGTLPSAGRPFLAAYAAFAASPKRQLEPGLVVLDPPDVFDTLCCENFIQTSSVTLRRSLLHAVGPFDESLTNGDDLDMWYRLAAVTSFAGLLEPTIYYRERPTSISARGARLAENRIRVLTRQLPHARGAARRRLRVWLAQNRFAQGWSHQDRAELRDARHYYWESFKLRPTTAALKGLTISLLPRTIYLQLRSRRGVENR